MASGYSLSLIDSNASIIITKVAEPTAFIETYHVPDAALSSLETFFQSLLPLSCQAVTIISGLQKRKPRLREVKEAVHVAIP